MQSTVFKEYREINGQTFRVEVFYDLGGYNYFTYKPKARGYYVSVTPVTLSKGNGYTTETYMAFSGYKHLLLEVKRKSKKAAAEALEFSANGIVKKLIRSCMYDLNMEIPEEYKEAV